jgi:hypothetical protein
MFSSGLRSLTWFEDSDVMGSTHTCCFGILVLGLCGKPGLGASSKMLKLKRSDEVTMDLHRIYDAANLKPTRTEGCGLAGYLSHEAGGWAIKEGLSLGPASYRGVVVCQTKVTSS